jgi:hypothetical protein
MRDKVSFFEWGVIVLFAVILLGVLAGCASSPQMVEVQKPVLIQGPTQYLPIPLQLFAGCLRPPSAGPLNGDLLMHDLAQAQYSLCLEAELAAIQSLKPPK